ncbi:MAG: TIM barrel protein [Lachnospiraceae bacterium]|nr:TIM barrel protein [Lachnospiraceae bacterium]
MAIKRGVSLYSYQQSQFFKKLDWKAQIREVREGLGTDGIEIINEQLIRHYPFPSEEFLYDWRSYMARYDMQAVTMDVYLDVHQFRDHVMTHREAAEHLKNDIRLAAEMGFQNVRTLVLVPVDVIEMALPTAEKYNVRIGKEIHAPWPIKPGNFVQPKKGMAAGINFRAVDEIVELRERTGSRYVGLVPDFGIFQHSPSDVAVAYVKRHAKNPDAVDWIRENAPSYSHDELIDAVDEKFPGHGIPINQIDRMALHKSCCRPEDLIDIMPYIVSIHGKFYNMTEIPGKPGCYEDKCIDYETPIKYLREQGFDGYINSEFEGQRDQQDMGIEGLVDEVEQVRRHHEMLKRLSG